MALLTVNNVSRAGALVASDGTLPTITTGDTFPVTGGEFVIIQNGTGGAMVVTLDIVPTVDGAAVVDKTVSLATGETKIIGPFPPTYYSNAGVAKVTCDVVTSSKIKVFKLTPES